MPKRVLLPLLITVLAIGCKKTEEPVVTETVVSETVVAAPSTTTGPTTTTAPAAPTSTPVVPAGASIASQETNWKGIVADITEFRRKGNTLTAKVRLTNRGSENANAAIKYGEVYLMDTAAGKKYEVLKDEKGQYIAYLTTGWNYQWYDTMEPNDAITLWMKFPAPPVEVRAITLQLPGMAPFEDVPIQD